MDEEKGRMLFEYDFTQNNLEERTTYLDGLFWKIPSHPEVHEGAMLIAEKRIFNHEKPEPSEEVRFIGQGILSALASSSSDAGLIERVVKVSLGNLSDESVKIRTGAAMALAMALQKSGNPPWVQHVKDALATAAFDPDPTLRKWAGGALAHRIQREENFALQPPRPARQAEEFAKNQRGLWL